MIKSRYPLITLAGLLLASLACSTLLGRPTPPAPTPLPDLIIEVTDTPTSNSGGGNEPTAAPGLAATPENGAGGGSFNTNFPLPDDVSDFIDLGNGAINFQTGMKLDEVMKFYKGGLTDSGLTERTLLTVTSDTTFSMVFDGAENGNSVVVQGVDLGSGKINVNIRYEKVP